MTLSDSSSHTEHSEDGQNKPEAIQPLLPRLYNFDLPHLKKTGQGFPADVDLSTIKRVLDIATGTGEWASLVARAYPEVVVVGIDNSSQADRGAVSDKLQFINDDPWQLTAIADDSVDLVNIRFITGQLPIDEWSHLLQACLRVTRSGGFICVTETDLPIMGNPASGQFVGLISDALFATGRSFSPTGRLLSVTPALKYLLLEAGYQDVQQEVYSINFSAGMKAHAEVTEDIARTYQLAQPFLVASGVATLEAVERGYQAMLAEMQSDDFVALAFYLSVSAKKP
jgi:SAM-dependent methyltransferase